MLLRNVVTQTQFYSPHKNNYFYINTKLHTNSKSYNIGLKCYKRYHYKYNYQLHISSKTNKTYLKVPKNLWNGSCAIYLESTLPTETKELLNHLSSTKFTY